MKGVVGVHVWHREGGVSMWKSKSKKEVSALKGNPASRYVRREVLSTLTLAKHGMDQERNQGVWIEENGGVVVILRGRCCY